MSATAMKLEPPRYRPHAAVQNSVAGMLIFIVTEIMFFAGLISAFLVVKSGAVWPPPGQPRLPIETTAFNTLVLFASGIALGKAERTLAGARDLERTQGLLSLAMSLGAFFVVFQGYEWVRLIGFGLTMTSSPYGAFFYLIVGAHALHAVAALLALGYCHLQLARHELTRTVFSATQIFWYFVVMLWPVLYVLVYLT
ncbi:MAG TPA: heme-copper oxidase subunit III [Methylomirabilota bacterium]|nr:heme-copper oxidase subunit III [Methylomirabilota bacterium]